VPNNANEEQSQHGASSIAPSRHKKNARPYLLALTLAAIHAKKDKTQSTRGNSTVKGGEVCVAIRNLNKQAANLANLASAEASSPAEGNSDKGRGDTFCRNVQCPKSHRLGIVPTRMLCTEKRTATECKPPASRQLTSATTLFPEEAA
jgi:hypothetical protein